MINRAITIFLAGLACLTQLSSCKNSEVGGEKAVRAIVPVTVVAPRTGKMTEYTELMATSAFLTKTVIKSPLTGYVEKCVVTPGDKVTKNQLLFQLRTREGAALHQDSIGSVSIDGLMMMKAPVDGVMSGIDHPQGDFIQEGDMLATMVVPGNLVFLLEAPFEMNSLIRIGEECILILPDKTEVQALVKSILPSMSGASQTQRMVLQPHTAKYFPENLMAKVRIMRKGKNSAVILPKSCLLNDEVMQNFWVMKLVNDTLAVKIKVETGLQSIDSIEVVSPLFTTTDRILNSGNYGLGDTAQIRIIRQE